MQGGLDVDPLGYSLVPLFLFNVVGILEEIALLFGQPLCH